MNLLLLFMIGLVFYIGNNKAEAESSICENKDKSHFSKKSAFHQILSRKRRFVIYPPGSAITATMSATKSIISNVPTGCNLITELDIFYPLPIKVEEWYPKAVKKTISSALPERKSTKEDRNQIWVNNNFHYIPYDQNYSENQTIKPTSNLWNYNRWRESVARSKYYNGQLAKSRNKSDSTYAQPKNYTNPFNIEDYKHWTHYQRHKDRRAIFEHFEDFKFGKGYAVKDCILRLICEARHFLLPPGISFFQDVMRILFLVPLMDNMNDEYSSAMRSSEAECINAYSTKCPYSILGYLLHKTQNNNSFM